MCSALKANGQQKNVRKANASVILAGDQILFSISLICHVSRSKFKETSAGKHLQNYQGYNILAVQAKQMNILSRISFFFISAQYSGLIRGFSSLKPCFQAE
jgi:hypothetical protein